MKKYILDSKQYPSKNLEITLEVLKKAFREYSKLDLDRFKMAKNLESVRRMSRERDYCGFVWTNDLISQIETEYAPQSFDELVNCLDDAFEDICKDEAWCTVQWVFQDDVDALNSKYKFNYSNKPSDDIAEEQIELIGHCHGGQYNKELDRTLYKLRQDSPLIKKYNLSEYLYLPEETSFGGSYKWYYDLNNRV